MQLDGIFRCIFFDGIISLGFLEQLRRFFMAVFSLALMVYKVEE